jgi:chorismate mutase
MSLYNRLLKERKRLGKFVLRSPKTNQELLDRKRWDRIVAILMRRYEYGIEDPVMEQYRYGDFRDEIAAVRR